MPRTRRPAEHKPDGDGHRSAAAPPSYRAHARRRARPQPALARGPSPRRPSPRRTVLSSFPERRRRARSGMVSVRAAGPAAASPRPLTAPPLKWPPGSAGLPSSAHPPAPGGDTPPNRSTLRSSGRSDLRAAKLPCSPRSAAGREQGWKRGDQPRRRPRRGGGGTAPCGAAGAPHALPPHGGEG